MIAEMISARDGRGVGGEGFAGCISYVTGKADQVETRNVASAQTAAREMRAIANEKPLKKPVLHFVISWRPGEHPTSEQMFAAADHTLIALGLENHQAVLGIHTDTDHHWHMHVVCNRRGLDGRRVDLTNDRFKLEKACREIEMQQGWSQDRGGWQTSVENGEVHLGKRVQRDKNATRPTKAEIDRERRTGREPLRLRLIQPANHEKLAAAFAESKSWIQLHDRLAEIGGLQYQLKGSGAKLCTIDDPGNACSPSHLDKDWSRSKLEQRFGPFEPTRPTAAIDSAIPRQHPAMPSDSFHRLDNAENDTEERSPESESVGSLTLLATEDYFYRHIAALIKNGFTRRKLEQQFEARRQAVDQATRQARRDSARAMKEKQQRRTIQIRELFASDSAMRGLMQEWEKRQKRRERSELKKERNGLRPPEWRAFLREIATTGNLAKDGHRTPAQIDAYLNECRHMFRIKAKATIDWSDGSVFAKHMEVIPEFRERVAAIRENRQEIDHRLAQQIQTTIARQNARKLPDL